MAARRQLKPESGIDPLSDDPYMPVPIPANILRAIRCGHIPILRDWRRIPLDDCTKGEKVCRFIETFLHIPEGPKVGQPFHLEVFQVVFVLSIFDSPVKVRKAILSVGRKAGKTALIAAIVAVFMFSWLAATNSQIVSGALGRNQAALIYKYLTKSLRLSPKLAGKWYCRPSAKFVLGLKKGVEFTALSADASTNMGLSPRLYVGDEWGQVVGPRHPFIEALETSQGAYDEDALAIIISTSAASDADWLSLEIDDAESSKDAAIVCHYYCAERDCELDDREQWMNANPATGAHRSVTDLEIQSRKAMRLPSAEAAFRNLQLNQRVSAEALFMAPSVWKLAATEVDFDVFRNNRCVMGLDLSARHDLTAAVLCAKDSVTNVVHIFPFVYTPLEGLKERGEASRAPYEDWWKEGKLIAIPGKVIDYKDVVNDLSDKLVGMDVSIDLVCFDRWRISLFKAECGDSEIFSNVQWQEVGQGYKDMSPCVETFETEIVNGRLAHGGHPLLTMAAASAIAVQDPAGNRKLDKSKSSRRIDPLVAALMGVHYAVTEPEFDVGSMVG